MLIERVTGWVIRRRWFVIAFWVVVASVGGAFSTTATHALSQRFSLPGQPAWEADQAITRTYGSGGTNPVVPVVTLPGGVTVDSPGVRQQLAAALGRIPAVVPGARVASWASTGDPAFVSPDRRTTFALVYAPATRGPDPGVAALPALRAALADTRVAGAPVYVTGVSALSNGNQGGGGVLVETLIGALGALLVLVFVFGSALALLPLVMAWVAIPTAYLLTWGLTRLTEVNNVAQYLIALIGLGVAIDYALLVVMRWREERARGAGNHEAVGRAMRTAGSTVVFSGTTVAIGLAALVALPVPVLRSLGYAGLLIPLISVAVAMTLLPAVLAAIGPRLEWPRRHRQRHDDRPSRIWAGWARLVVRYRWVAALLAVAVLVALIVPTFSLRLGGVSADALAKHGEARDGVVALEQSGLGAGALTPTELLVQGQAGDPAAVAGRVAAVPGVRAAVSPGIPDWRRGGTALVEVFQVPDATTTAARDTLDRVRHAVEAMPGVRLGGGPAEGQDFVHVTYGHFPLMAMLIVLVTVVLLARAFRSVVLPLKALLLNVLSVGAAWGVLVLVWQQGHGSKAIWGIDPTGSITQWVPLMVFAFLFGLSMDYEVFILSRVREAYDASGDTTTAIVNGIGRTGRLVTSGALILFLAFVSLAAIPVTDVKVMATGLAAGIILDATVIRALLVPPAMSLLGRANWWLPRPLARVLAPEARRRHAPAAARGGPPAPGSPAASPPAR